MYDIKMDLRANDGKEINVKECGGHFEITIDDCVVDATIKVSYELWNKLINQACLEHNIRTYEEISKENLRLKGIIG